MTEQTQTVLDILSRAVLESHFSRHAAALLGAVEQSPALRHGQWHEWLGAIDAIAPGNSGFDLTRDAINIQAHAAPESSLRTLMPWRKGPFQINEHLIDCEWRSDWKWQRIAPALEDIAGQRVLDVGGGNGYFSWRLAGAGAHSVMNIDPTALFVAQFLAVQRMLNNPAVLTLPLTLEALPAVDPFDHVLSMGVLYHRPDPIGHIKQLAQQLKPGGQLLLETLIVPGDETRCLTPEGRYARMRNVWFIPSSRLLSVWLERSGFSDIKVIDVNYTSIDEQRTTDWMPFESLRESLDPDNSQLTIEGHPAPLRTTLVAKKAR
ncbi:MAG: tRNA 5-methoxyuridine(34)/uridine 5-oxyacetic acid(34) synthase CmoB [Pseudomonadota bacterium]